MTNKIATSKIIGKCGVDSGQLLIIDPCYLNKWKDGEVDFDKKKYLNDYDEACKITCGKNAGGEHSKLGVVLSSGYGDGVYPIKAFYNEKGIIIKIEIDFD